MWRNPFRSVTHRALLKQEARPRRGQAIMLLLALLFAMVIMAFWVIDTHTSVLVRLRAQDCGDPVALAAAKWQAAGLNLIGELNLIHAYMLADYEDNFEEAEALHGLQQRITLTTPLLALQTAQHTAELNHADPLDGAKDFLRDCARWIELPDLYPEATQDFHDALNTILRKSEIYAFPIYEVFPNADSLLGNQDFYEAVLADDYCWFWFNAYSFLNSYRGHHSFGPVPNISTELFFSLNTRTVTHTLKSLYGDLDNPNNSQNVVRKMNQQMHELGHPEIPPYPKNEASHPYLYEMHMSQPWMAYGNAWEPWTRMRRTELPLRADIRPEYDVLGAHSTISVSRNGYSWLTAAKPFGGIIDGEPPRTNDLILGGFDVVRLVPVDSVGANLRSFDVRWFRHIYLHIKDYSRLGRIFDGCRYCRALQKWDGPSFRPQAILWLSQHGHTCRRPRPGPGGTGGSSYAH